MPKPDISVTRNVQDNREGKARGVRLKVDYRTNPGGQGRLELRGSIALAADGSVDPRDVEAAPQVLAELLAGVMADYGSARPDEGGAP